MKICSKCGKEWPTEKKFPYQWKKKCRCGSTDYHFSTRDGTMTSNNAVYDG